MSSRWHAATPPPGAGSATTRCTPASAGTQPDLTAMTSKALSLLDNPDGFFLQVESAMIDKQEHAMDICGAIGDLEMIDETVKVALDYQKTHPDTLVIVTGDHAHSTQIVGSVNDGRQTATLQTADGDPLTVAYSTALGGSNHTGSQIRVAAIGPQAANVTGVIDQTDLFDTMLGRTPSTLPTAPTVTVTATPAATPTPTPTTTPTTPAPTTPAPTCPRAGTPSVWVAAPKKITRGAETWISVTVDGATEVKVRVTQGRKTTTRKLSDDGGSVRLPQLRKGSARIKVVAKAEAGRTTSTRTIAVR